MDDRHDPPPLRPATALRSIPWKRRPAEGLVSGVCAGLARHIGWKPRRLRLLLVASTFVLCGMPALLYLLAAKAVPADDST